MCLTAFSKRAVLIWTLLCNIVYILWCSGFRNYHYGINDAALLYTYLAFSILTILGVFLKRKSWIYFGIIVYIVAAWTSFWYFWSAWKTSIGVDISEFNFVQKMIAVRWPLHIFHAVKDFWLCLVLSQHYDEEFGSEDDWSSSGSVKFLDLVLFAKPMKDGQVILLLSHVLGFILMVVELGHKLNVEKASVIVEQRSLHKSLKKVTFLSDFLKNFRNFDFYKTFLISGCHVSGRQFYRSFLLLLF